MQDEIKELLDYYQKDIDRYEKNMINYTEYQQRTTFSKNYQKYKNHKLLLNYITNLQEENERLNNIINHMEEDLREMYMTFGEFNEEYTEKKIQELKEGE